MTELADQGLVRAIGLSNYALARVAEERGVGMAQLAIAWVLAQPGVTSAICGSRNPAHIGSNSAAAGSSWTTPPWPGWRP
jgi:aryl-alcohol dehydrogenase-like predicted oxidoreductase